MEEEFFMEKAVALAKLASEQDEVPVGAVIVRKNKIIGEGYNQTIRLNDPTAHAEILALRDAALNLNNYRLDSSTMFVTLEPCMMCLGALVHARISKLIFAARDEKTGVIVSNNNALDMNFLNHKVSYSEGPLGKQSSELLKEFFLSKREKPKC